ncbi:MAG: phage tail sheath family protein [archaeon]
MPELLSPGVKIQEVSFGPQPIEGVSTSTAGFVGETERGPDEGPPILITSFPDFQREFGGFVEGKYLPLAVRGFFDNGGRRAFIARVAGPNADRARKTLERSGHLANLEQVPIALSGGQWRIKLSSVVGIGSTITWFPKDGGGSAGDSTVLQVDGTTGVVRVDDATDLTDMTPATHYVQVTADPGGGDDAMRVEARDKGSFGDRISVFWEPRLGDNAVIESSPTTDDLVLSSVAFLEFGARVQLINGANSTVTEVTSIDAGARRVTVADADGIDDGRLHLVEWGATVTFDGDVVETLDGLSATLTAGEAAALQQQVADRSRWIRVFAPTGENPPPIDPADANSYPTLPRAEPVALESGTDDDAGATDVVGTGVAPRTGLKAIEAQEGVNIIAAPGFSNEQTVVNELIGQSERQQDRFAVFESAGADHEPTEVLTQRGLYNSQYAAMYYPWVIIRDPLTRRNIPIPPTGHVLGAFARTDNDRGVFKAPANVVLRSILGFSVEVSTGEQDLLNPAGVNVLRRLDGLGNVIWGARTISAETLWRYVPVRRLFIFLEQSIVRGTRFAVFEPNDPRLWSRLRDALTNFLTSQWRAGALFGRTPEEAFFVKVDETTTTQDDRDNGRVNIVVGIAPVKPAEFVIFRIGQAPTSVIIEESEG